MSVATAAANTLVGAVFVPGNPAPQGSMKGHVIQGRAVLTTDNRRTKPWRADVHARLLDELEGGTIVFPGKEPVALSCEFVMPRTASEPKTKTRPHTKAPDVDKLVRALLDSLTGIVYRDDSQVTTLSISKRTAEVGEMPGAHVSWAPDPCDACKMRHS
jgi:Holliday junction resolvase RusA-like endonuclease